MHSPGVRAVPSLTYLSFQTNFYIGPDPAGDSDVVPTLPQLALAAQTATRSVKTAQSTAPRYQIEDQDFHSYTSKYDYWLEGKARLSAAEMRGYMLFNDPAKGDCGACHLDQPTPDRRPPQFTDTQYEALGVPRNPDIPANQDPHYYDLGLCGPYRTDLRGQTQYCGMFLTPTLRNAATRAQPS